VRAGVQREFNRAGLLVATDHDRGAGRAHRVGAGYIAGERIRGQALDPDVTQSMAFDAERDRAEGSCLSGSRTRSWGLTSGFKPRIRTG
jgi:hypothetical protein